MTGFSQTDQLFFVAQTAFRDRTAEVGFDRKDVLANEPPQDRPERGEVGVTPCPPPPYVSSVRRWRSERGRPCGSGRGGAALARRPIRRAAEVGRSCAEHGPRAGASGRPADCQDRTQTTKNGSRRVIALADGFTELAAPARSSLGQSNRSWEGETSGRSRRRRSSHGPSPRPIPCRVGGERIWPAHFQCRDAKIPG